MNEKSIAAMAAGLPILLLPACSKGPEKPNIVFFLVDDFGWMDTQVPFAPKCYPENNRHDTPNFLQMAEEGAVFTNACLKTTATLPSTWARPTGRRQVRRAVRPTIWDSLSTLL